MARVVVIGGGLGGMASAARLAKLGHEVTLLERMPQLGGAVSFVTSEGFSWDAGPTSTLLPGVLRDLFRKSGRPLEKELELVPLELVREHHFADGTSVTLPGGSRGAQVTAIDEAEGYSFVMARACRVVRRHVGPAAPQLLRTAVAPRDHRQGRQRPARHPHHDGQGGEEGVQGQTPA